VLNNVENIIPLGILEIYLKNGYIYIFIGTRDLDLNKKNLYRFELSFSFLKSDGLTSLPCIYIIYL
jgi:hypothetical protein